ncbi:hypothetical protein MUK42_28293 [Musa troglodytarum]|uniref:Uncharacterized protein n=1 Tax=Musa troglodytarum TaxID=320322 RepID=A0A9E7JLW6_9LILI|nr:hypothetical protein MUK42_28293 [Musa troglodytarum]URD85569.1 hypothetical protein MUK42_28293 [Musa troglodytarum]URD85573.1 hypothetical protein MUK42_28293 [Musa troglodytarum]URD85574.1 hypothetical protein MUK42_28293 [Musa troglodytarum]URD85575.1 hypothetical protein MUK42_28293 [Musa troglodytarum]
MDPITKGGETSAGDGGPMEETDTVLHAAAAEAASFVPPRLEDAGLKDCALGGDSVMEALTRAAISLLPTCIGEDVLDEGHGEALRRKRRCISSWLGGLRFGRAEERGGFRFLPIWKK